MVELIRGINKGHKDQQDVLSEERYSTLVVHLMGWWRGLWTKFKTAFFHHFCATSRVWGSHGKYFLLLF